MTTRRSCIECGRVTDQARCPEHRVDAMYHTPEHRAAQREARLHVGDPCPTCGRPMVRPSVEHIKDLLDGGTNDASNTTVVCLPCNVGHVRRRGEGRVKSSR